MVTDRAEKAPDENRSDSCESRTSSSKEIPKWNGMANISCPKLNELLCCQRVAHSVLFYIFVVLFLLVLVYILRKIVSLPVGLSKHGSGKPSNSTVHNHSSDALTKRLPPKWPKVDNFVEHLPVDTLTPAAQTSPKDKKSRIYSVAPVGEHGYAWSKLDTNNENPTLEGTTPSHPQGRQNYLRQGTVGYDGTSISQDKNKKNILKSASANLGFSGLGKLDSRLPAWNFKEYNGSDSTEGSYTRVPQSELRNRVTSPVSGGSYENWGTKSSSWPKWGSSWPAGSGFVSNPQNPYDTQSSSQKTRFYYDRASGKWTYSSNNGNAYNDNPTSKMGVDANAGRSIYTKAISSNSWNPYNNNGEMNQTKDWSNFNALNGQGGGMLPTTSNSVGHINDIGNFVQPAMTNQHQEVNQQHQTSAKVAVEEMDDRFHRWPLEKGRGEEPVDDDPSHLHVLNSRSSKRTNIVNHVKRKKSKHRRLRVKHLRKVAKTKRKTRSKRKRKEKAADNYKYHSSKIGESKISQMKTQVRNNVKKSMIPRHSVLNSHSKRHRVKHHKVKSKATSKVEIKLRGNKPRLSPEVRHRKIRLHGKRRLKNTAISKNRRKSSIRWFSSYSSYKRFVKGHQISDVLVGTWHRATHHVRHCKTLSQFKTNGKVKLGRQYMHQKRKYKYTVLSCRYIDTGNNDNEGEDRDGNSDTISPLGRQICREFWYITTGKIMLRTLKGEHGGNNYIVTLCNKRSSSKGLKDSLVKTSEDEEDPTDHNDNDDADSSNANKETGNDDRDLNSDVRGDHDDTDTDDDNRDTDKEIGDRNDDVDIDDKIDTEERTRNDNNDDIDLDDDDIDNNGPETTKGPGKEKHTDNKDSNDDDDFDKDSDYDDQKTDTLDRITDDDDTATDTDDILTESSSDSDSSAKHDSENDDRATENDDDVDLNTRRKHKTNHKRKKAATKNKAKISKIHGRKLKIHGRKGMIKKSSIHKARRRHLKLHKKLKPNKKQKHNIASNRDANDDNSNVYERLREVLSKNNDINDEGDDALAKIVAAISKKANPESSAKRKKHKKARVHSRKNESKRKKNMTTKIKKSPLFENLPIKDTNAVSTLLRKLISNNIKSRSQVTRKKATGVESKGKQRKVNSKATTKETKVTKVKQVSKVDTKDVLKALIPRFLPRPTSVTTAAPTATAHPPMATTHAPDPVPIISLLRKLGIKASLAGNKNSELEGLIPANKSRDGLSRDKILHTKKTSAFPLSRDKLLDTKKTSAFPLSRDKILHTKKTSAFPLSRDKILDTKKTSAFTLSRDKILHTKKTSAFTPGVPPLKVRQLPLLRNAPAPISPNPSEQPSAQIPRPESSLRSRIPTAQSTQNYLKRPTPPTFTTSERNTIAAPSPQGSNARTTSDSTSGYSAYRSPKNNPHSLQTPSINILCFGDSLTSGYYNHGRGEHPYSIRLNQLLDPGGTHRYKIVTRGMVGEMVHGDMTKRLPKVLNEGTRFDWVLILGGTNDVAHVKNFGDDEDFTRQLINVWSPKIVNDIEKLHEIARQYGARTVLMTIPETAYELWPEFRSIRSMRLSVNAALRQYATQVRDTTVLCDLAVKLPRSSLSNELLKFYWNDHIHMNPVGYDKMAEVIQQCIRPYLTK